MILIEVMEGMEAQVYNKVYAVMIEEDYEKTVIFITTNKDKAIKYKKDLNVDDSFKVDIVPYDIIDDVIFNYDWFNGESDYER